MTSDAKRFVEAIMLALSPSSRSLTAAYNGFALSLLRQIRKQPGNLCCSPFSISTTLAMMLEDCTNRMADRTIKLFMPSFKTTWGAVDLQPALAALGMSLPFDPQRADFSGVNGLRPPNPEALVIGAVFHKAFTEVNEEGTEAAAATAVSMFAGSAPSLRPQTIPVFRADHPFLYLIRDRPSGGILFVGRVSDPTRED